ncbi:MAG: four-carbon acid sugar kinase family protein, partial [Candidatus Gastranaerophilales bacterium]|nr:four-carbon acid sugar kinase family protein [Candidatus Gastranaerophilales bacterium]
MIISNLVGVIADDLTGANDTALQFKKCHAKTKILLDYSIPPENDANTEIWAISTESRNIGSGAAEFRMLETISNLNKNLNLEYFYKKIDSTVRGNIAIETLTMVKVLDYDASIIIPAFPSEGRITVGGYHLSKGIPIGRTEMARDPHSPITESHVPSLLKSQLHENEQELVGSIGLKTVMNGAGPILMKINELIKEGRKLIVADAASLTDIEQIVLAINKSSYKILPAGTAATGNILAKLWLPEAELEECEEVKIPKLPKLIISGSATQINAHQIEQLEQSYDYDNVCTIPLNTEMVINGLNDEFINDIIEKLGNDNIVVI